MTVSEVREHGRQKGHTEVFRGREYDVDLLPKIKVELVLSDDTVESAIEAISDAAHTGKIGDGKIFLYNVGGATEFAAKNGMSLQSDNLLVQALASTAWLPRLIYSSRNRTSGSTASARRAGIRVANRPSRSIVNATPHSTNVSYGVA